MYSEEEIFNYLNELRDSGETNMFGAGAFLQEKFGMDTAEASGWIGNWMNSYNKPYCEDCE